MELFERIKTLNAAHGPSGDEGDVREAIARLAAPYADASRFFLMRSRHSSNRVISSSEKPL